MVLLCHLHPSHRLLRNKRHKLKVKAYVLETIPMVKREKPVKKLPAHCFVSLQGKMEETWGSQLTTCSRTGACNMSLCIFAKQIGCKKSALLEERRHHDRKTNDASKMPKFGGSYREGRRTAMKNGMEGRFSSRGKHSDGLLYCRGEWVWVALGWQERPQ